MDIDRFVEDCIAANGESDPQAAVNEVLARAVSIPKAVLAVVGGPEQAALNPGTGGHLSFTFGSARRQMCATRVAATPMTDVTDVSVVT